MMANEIDSLRIVLGYQTEGKERLQSLYKISRAYLISGDTTGLPFWEECMELAQNRDDEQVMANLFYLKGYYERGFRANHAEAFVAFHMAKELYENLGDHKLLAATGLLIAEYYRNIGEYKTAENLYREVEVKLLEINDLREIGRLHEHLGVLHDIKDDHQKAIDEFNIAISYFNQTGSWNLLCSNLNTLGKIQERVGNTAEARISLSRAIQISVSKSLTTIDGIYAKFNLGKVIWKEGDLAKAQAQLEEAYGLAFDYQPAHTETFRMAQLLGEFYRETEQTQKETELLLAQAAYMPESPNETQLLVYHQLVSLYRATQQWELALDVSEKLNAAQVAFATSALRAEDARQASEVSLARKILADREEEAAYRRAEQRWLWACVITALVLLAVAGYIYFLKEKHRKKALANATHWPELNKRMQALEDALNVLY